MRSWPQLQAAHKAMGAFGVLAHVARRTLPADVHTLGIWSWPVHGIQPPQLQEGMCILPATLADLAAQQQRFQADKPMILRESGLSRHWLAAWQNGALVGFSAWTLLAAEDVLSHDTWVHPAARRFGLGQALLRAVAVEVRAQVGAGATLWGEVVTWNRASKAMLAGLGWTRRGVALRVQGRTRACWPPEPPWPKALLPRKK